MVQPLAYSIAKLKGAHGLGNILCQHFSATPFMAGNCSFSPDKASMVFSISPRSSGLRRSPTMPAVQFIVNQLKFGINVCQRHTRHSGGARCVFCEIGQILPPRPAAGSLFALGGQTRLVGVPGDAFNGFGTGKVLQAFECHPIVTVSAAAASTIRLSEACMVA
jgi:hypothetical protein